MLVENFSSRYYSIAAPVVQWIGCSPPKGTMQVRFLPGAPKGSYRAKIQTLYCKYSILLRFY
jgi:hypothetical protein